MMRGAHRMQELILCGAVGFGFSKIEDAAQFTCRYIAEDVPALERFLLK